MLTVNPSNAVTPGAEVFIAQEGSFHLNFRNVLNFIVT